MEIENALSRTPKIGIQSMFRNTRVSVNPASNNLPYITYAECIKCTSLSHNCQKTIFLCSDWTYEYHVSVHKTSCKPVNNKTTPDPICSMMHAKLTLLRTNLFTHRCTACLKFSTRWNNLLTSCNKLVDVIWLIPMS